VIRVLEDQVVNKIAAGEVVERPASALKELLENSIDAGARTLRIDLEAGGRNLLRVGDDGHGMDRQDATLCLERHATSKIQSDEDLFEVGTLGFRGEAIPSIAAVSRFELLTRQASAAVGTRVVVEGGKLMTIEDAGAAPGTQVTVRSLFFNVPARRKFLRTVQTELSHCAEAVTRVALVRPDIDVELHSEGATLLRAPRVDDLAARAADLLGPDGAALVPIHFQSGTLEVVGLLSPVGVHRGSNQGSSYLYVNGRFVRDPVLRRAVTEAYRNLVPVGRHALVVLDVRVPRDHVDVNVHPAKTEVRFQHAGDLQRVVAEGIREALQRTGIHRPLERAMRPMGRPTELAGRDQLGLPVAAVAGPLWGQATVVADGPPPEPHVETPPVGEAARAPQPPRPMPPMTGPDLERWPTAAPTPEDIGRQPLPPDPQAEVLPPADPRALLPVPRFADLRVIGQLNRTYVLCEGRGELVVVDQHAAHERIALFRIKAAAALKGGGGQRLLHPAIVELAPARARALLASGPLLLRYGLEVEPFGGNSFAVKQVPAALSQADPTQLLVDVADDLAQGGEGAPAQDIIDRALATMACHTSVRAGQVLSTYEMRELLVALDAVDFSVCAHGRPVLLRINAAELERRFHRT
jgi:DNA mismatch repair protein MutL